MTAIKAYAFLLLVILTVSPAVLAKDLQFTEEVGARLVTSLWKKTEGSYDITLQREMQTKPRSREEIRKILERAFAEEAKSPNHPPMSPQELTARINKETDSWLENEGKPKTFKERYVFSGGNTRLDQTLAAKPGDLEGPFQNTYISVPPKGDVEGYYCNVNHRQKNAFVNKQPWRTTRYEQLGAFSQAGAGLKMMVFGEIQKGADSKPVMTPDGQLIITPDQNKIPAIARGEGPHRIKLSAEVDEAGRNVHVVTLAGVANGKEVATVRWALDARNYDICYRQEAANKDGTWRPMFEAEDFQRVEGSEYMLPRKVSLFEYDTDRSLKERKDITITKAVASATVDAQLFAAVFPSDYTVTRNVAGQSITTEPLDMPVPPLETNAQKANVVSPTPEPEPEPTTPVAPVEPREQDKGHGALIWVLIIVAAVGVVGALVALRRRK